MNIKEYIKKNWKNLAFILIIALLIFTNVRQYRSNTSVYKDNMEMNIKYAALLEKIGGIDAQIAQYQSEAKKKDSAILVGKQEIAQTEAVLQVSQSEVKRLSKKILGNQGGVIKPEDFAAYSEVCDSLAVVAPILSDQVDTLKTQNKALVKNYEQKTSIQDSIIKRKDGIILDQTAFLNRTVEGYNDATAKLQTTENKLNKAKKNRGFWQKLAIGLGLGLVGVLSVK